MSVTRHKWKTPRPCFTHLGSLTSMGRKTTIASSATSFVIGQGDLVPEIPAIPQRAEKSGAQIGENNQGKGIHLRFQNRRERARPNHFHRHRAKSRRKQNPCDQPRPAEGRRGKCRCRCGFCFCQGETAGPLRHPQPIRREGDGEIARGGNPERVPEPQNFHQNERRKKSAAHRPQHVGQIKKTETFRVFTIPLPDVSHHQRKGRPHEHAPRQNGKRQHQGR